MKRSPLKRKTRLSLRRKPPSSKPSKAEQWQNVAPGLETRRRSERVYDEKWLAVVRTMTCCARALPGHTCEGPHDPDHAGRRPMGRKASDDTAIPLCRKAHRDRDAFAGVFRGWTHDQMRAWLDEQIARTRAFVEKLRARGRGTSTTVNPTEAS